MSFEFTEQITHLKQEIKTSNNTSHLSEKLSLIAENINKAVKESERLKSSNLN